MGVAASNSSNVSKQNRPNPTKHPKTEGFTETPQEMHRSFMNEQILEYTVKQPNIYMVPASNYEYLASNNANKTNATLQDSIFGTLQTIYGRTNTVVVTPEDNRNYRNYRSNIYSNYYNPSKYVDETTGTSQYLSNVEATKQLTSPFSRIFDFIMPEDKVSEEIVRGQDECERYNSLSNNVEQYYQNKYIGGAWKDNYRCGFVYNPNYLHPDGTRSPVFRGHLGSVKTNFISKVEAEGIPQVVYKRDIFDSTKNPGTKFYWNMDDTSSSSGSNIGARNAFLQYYCQMNVPTCGDLDNHNNVNSIKCAWSKPLGRAVPSISIPPNYLGLNPQTGIKNNFGSGYYNGDRRITPQTMANNYPEEYYNVYSRSANCPPDEIIPVNPGIDPSIPTNCYTDGFMQNGSGLTPNCVKSLLNQVGCENNGGFYKAMNTARPKDTIYSCNAFIRYNQVYNSDSTNDNLKRIFESENVNAQTIKRDLRILQSNSIKPDNSSEIYAARDLCLSNGTYQTFDFCTEYGPDTLAGPDGFLLECVQQYFRVQGGQKSGRKYPITNTDTNMTYYNSLSTWRVVTAAIDDLLEKTKSSDINTQAIAFNDFYGINAQQFKAQYIPSIPGVEILWFSVINSQGSYNISEFLGRRIQADLTLNKNGINQNPIQFISFFNLKAANNNNTSVKYSFNNTDKIQILKNKNFGAPTTTDGDINGSWNLSQTERNTRNTSCWSISAATGNYFTITWLNTVQNGNFVQEYFRTCDTVPINVNSTGGPKMVLSQEEDAPMISFQVIPDPTENQINFFSSEKVIEYKFGDARLWNVMPINNLNPSLTTSLTTTDTTYKFDFTNRFIGNQPAGTQNLTTDYTYLYGSERFKSNSIRETIVIENQGWRTMTMLFKTGNLVEIGTGLTNYLLEYGELKVGIINNGTDTSPSYKFLIKYDTGTATAVNNILPNKKYYLIIIQDFDTISRSALTTTLKVSCSEITLATNSDYRFVINTYQTTTIPNNPSSALWKMSTNEYKLRIGGKDVNGNTRTVIMDVGWLRIFDYVFNIEDVKKDLNNKWDRNWWNMI